MISLVQPSELSGVTDLAKWFFQSSGMLGEFHADSFIQSWSGLLASGHGFILRRAGQSGVAVEAMGVLVYPDPNTGELCASTAFWYIAEPEKSLAAGLLHRELEAVLKSRGIKYFFLSSLINHRHDRVETFLLHAGYRPVEVHYAKELT